mmetsp:Transcript_12933/g.35861  ORF Transcript_12933/g.35861 Transcript_12933/m.35861 type:complete len:141 (-) Transcript_12933:871-1293(-)
MMRTYGFSAREAIAWLRVMRPGSVIGEQQQYLCRVEALVESNQSGLSPGMMFEDLPALLEFQKPCQTGFKSTSLGAAETSCQNGGGSEDAQGIEVSFDGARSSPAALAQQVIEGSDRRAAAAAARAAVLGHVRLELRQAC